MDKELIIEIDKVLKELTSIGMVSLTKQDSELRNKSIRYLISNNFIYKDSKYYKPNATTYEIEKIGIDNFLKDKQNKEVKEIIKETQETIIRKGTIESFEYGKIGFYISIIALLVSLLTLILK